MTNSLLSKLKYFDRISIQKLNGRNLNEKQINCIQEIKNQGYCVIDDFIPKEKLDFLSKLINDQFENHFFELPCFSQTLVDESNPNHQKLIKNNFSDSPSGYYEKGLAFSKKEIQGLSIDQILKKYSPPVLKTFPPKNSMDFFRIWLTPYLLEIIEGYMGIRPYLREAYIRRNFPTKYKVMNHNWHRDRNEKGNVLKAFFFLNDCTIENGPHEYIKSSHLTSDLTHKSYFSDSEIKSYCETNNHEIVQSIVKAGTVIIEDTTGLHRARPPISRHRDLGYAVFAPIRLFNQNKYNLFEIESDIVSNFSKYQKSFIPKGSICKHRN